MWQTIQTFIETNPTLTAIYSGAIGGSLFYYCRNIFTKVFNTLDRMVSFDLQSRVLMKDNYLQESLLRLIESSKCLYKKDYELNWNNNVQSADRTLTDEECDKAMRAAISALETEFGAQLRG